LSFQFLFVGRNVASGDTIQRLGTMVKFGIWFELDVKLPFGIATNMAGQNVAVIL
jgi:hypothetical protein